MHLLIPAAGIGRRMGSTENKLRLSLLERPLLAWTLMAAEASSLIEWLGIIGQPTDFAYWQQIIAALELKKPLELIPGGATRQESVYNGLQALPTAATKVLIHDGARCLATTELIDRCALKLADSMGLIAAVPVKDTIKVMDQAGLIQTTPDRAKLWAAQTPQGFAVDKLKHCHEQGQAQGWQVTDDAALFERFQLPVQVVMGEETNLKITTPADLAIAEAILRQRFESV